MCGLSRGSRCKNLTFLISFEVECVHETFDIRQGGYRRLGRLSMSRKIQKKYEDRNKKAEILYRVWGFDRDFERCYKHLVGCDCKERSSFWRDQKWWWRETFRPKYGTYWVKTNTGYKRRSFERCNDWNLEDPSEARERRFLIAKRNVCKGRSRRGKTERFWRNQHSRRRRRTNKRMCMYFMQDNEIRFERCTTKQHDVGISWDVY